MKKAVINKPNIVFRILATLVSIVLSIALLVMLLVTPYIESLRSISNPNNIAKAVSKIDFNAFAQNASREFGADYDLAELGIIAEIIQSDAGIQAVEDYTNQIISEIKGKKPYVTVDADYIYQLLTPYKTEFLSDEEKEEYINNPNPEYEEELDAFTKEMAASIAKVLPVSEDILSAISSDGKIDENDYKQIRWALSFIVTFILILISLFFIVLLWLVKRYKRKYLVWLAICFGISGIVVGISGILTGSVKLAAGLLGDSQAYLILFKPIIAIFGNRILLYGLVFIVLMILCIILKAATNAAIRKKTKKSAENYGYEEVQPELIKPDASAYQYKPQPESTVSVDSQPESTVPAESQFESPVSQTENPIENDDKQ